MYVSQKNSVQHPAQMLVETCNFINVSDDNGTQKVCYCKIFKTRGRKFRLAVDMYQLCLPLAIRQHMDFHKCIASTINYVIAWLL
jgi:hypothetical protein